MKTLSKVAVFLMFVAVIMISLPQQSHSKKRRKLPVKSYLSGARIAHKPNGDETSRPYDALHLLDSCTMWYGMVPEAYFWETMIHSDLAQLISTNDTADLHARLFKLVAASDSLAMSCEADNEEVKKKYKKKCEQFQITADSIRSDWFATYFNEAQQNRGELVDLGLNIAEETDSVIKAEIQADQNALLAKTMAEYEVATELAPTDSLAELIVLNLASLFSADLKDYARAIPYLNEAAQLAKVSDPGNYTNLLNQVAFSNYQLGEFLEAARIWHEVIDEVDDEQKLDLYNNILACFSSLQIDDSLLFYNQQVLAVDPSNSAALSMLGGTWFNRIQDLNQVVSEAKDAGDKDKIASAEAELEKASDSAIVYLERAFQSDSTDAQSLKLYAISNTLRGNRDKATGAWLRLTALEPDNKSHWVYLAENYIAQQQLKEAIMPYEKAVELDDSDKDIWLRLVELYGPHGMPEKQKKAQAKYDALSAE